MKLNEKIEFLESCGYEKDMLELTEEKILDDLIEDELLIEGFTEDTRKEELDEAKAKDPEGLADELEEIKQLADNYGYEYFTAMPFTAFDDDPESLELRYPNFFKVVKSFFKEMQIVDDINDTDELDDNFDSLDQHDWDTIIRVCEILSEGNGVQIEKVFKNNFDDTLDDDKIKADREANDEFEEEEFDGDESLKESSDDRLENIEYSIKALEDEIESLEIKVEGSVNWPEKHDQFKQELEDAKAKLSELENIRDGMIGESLNESKVKRTGALTEFDLNDQDSKDIIKLLEHEFDINTDEDLDDIASNLVLARFLMNHAGTAPLAGYLLFDGGNRVEEHELDWEYCKEVYDLLTSKSESLTEDVDDINSLKDLYTREAELVPAEIEEKEKETKEEIKEIERIESEIDKILKKGPKPIKIPDSKVKEEKKK